MAVAVQADQAADARAVARCRAGQADAFAEVVERHQAAVYATALRLIGDREAALEVANTTFYKAYRALASVDASRPLRPWLVRIASNEALSYLRERGRDARRTLSGEAGEAALAGLPAAEAQPEGAALADEQRAAVHRALAALPEPYRLVTVLRYLHDLSYAEIAAQTGLPTGTVGVYLLRAREQLRGRLAAEGVTADALS
ncbi:MAG TPA: sigma-70 family RNA polymerase sigma factor [Chloroflexota bacterium]|nr:sigma-70 family RNA polymerase sigma factor [Chloroflexota bacterium]